MPDLWLAMPDSALSDEQTKRDKSIKIGQIARACSIFRVKRIYIYHDNLSMFERTDVRLLKTILQFLDTPQYLRRVLYPRMQELEYAGILHPIKAPHHKPVEDIKKVSVGSIRTGVLAKVRGQLFVEVGLGSLVPFAGEGFEGKKVTVKFVSSYPKLAAEEAKADDIRGYWGYDVKEVPSISKLVNGLQNTVTVVTSRKGAHFKNIEEKLCQKIGNSQTILVIFGAPKYGVHEILAKEGATVNTFEFVVNMFPDQATETVRLEEAILGSLAILNNSLS